MKQYDDRSSSEACAKERQFSNPTRAVVQATFQNVFHFAYPLPQGQRCVIAELL
jgi:hypothetical protein